MKPAIFGAIVLYMQMACSTEQPSFSESRTSSKGAKSDDANASGVEGGSGEIIVGSAGNDAGSADDAGIADGDNGTGSNGSDGTADSSGVDASGADAEGIDAGGAGNDGAGNGGEEITPPDVVIANCANGIQKTKVVPISFPARQDCSWGTQQNDGGGNMTEVLSSNGNLSIKDGWIRAHEEQSAVVTVPTNSLLCSINMSSNTNTIHFDDFFALRIENFVVAASKVLANALATDADGHYVWDWPRIRGNGSAGTGTQMQDIGKYCGTGDCSLPEHDMPGNFAVGFALGGTSAGMNAKLFSKLSNLREMKFTTTATGDNDAEDCYHSGGAFTVTLKYVDKPN
jgi:hypothetical protein